MHANISTSVLTHTNAPAPTRSSKYIHVAVFKCHIVEYDRLGLEQIVRLILDDDEIAICYVTPRNTWLLSLACRRKDQMTVIERVKFKPARAGLIIEHAGKKYIVKNVKVARGEMRAAVLQCKHDLGLVNLGNHNSWSTGVTE